jgi:hypothetical protein
MRQDIGVDLNGLRGDGDAHALCVKGVTGCCMRQTL